jgi:hypothetical protein
MAAPEVIGITSEQGVIEVEEGKRHGGGSRMGLRWSGIIADLAVSGATGRGRVAFEAVG